MKIPNNESFNQIAITDSSDIDLENLINLYKIYIAKPYPFLANNATLPSDNHFPFRCNFLEYEK